MITTIDKNAALILIDLQKGITHHYPIIHPAANVLAKAAALVKAFRLADKPIIYVNVNPAGAKLTNARKDAKPFSGTMPPDWTEIVPEIDPQPTDIFITKRTWGAFFETNLQTKLQERGITNIVLAGISTSIGVEATARQAAELGYNLTFATDAMTDTIQSAHEHSINVIFPRLGEVGTVDDVISHL